MFDDEKAAELEIKKAAEKLANKKRSKTIDDVSSEEEAVEVVEDLDNENGLEITNKAVDRGNKLTRAQLNLKLIKRLKRQNQEN